MLKSSLFVCLPPWVCGSVGPIVGPTLGPTMAKKTMERGK